jgi:hypothetical protein
MELQRAALKARQKRRSSFGDLINPMRPDPLCSKRVLFSAHSADSPMICTWA